MGTLYNNYYIIIIIIEETLQMCLWYYRRTIRIKENTVLFLKCHMNHGESEKKAYSTSKDNIFIH